MSDFQAQLQATLNGAYTLERELSGGGMSRVFVADEVRLGRKVVVKVLSPELAVGISAERFEREIRMAASLQQANIVPVLSAGNAGGLPYFTMPYVEGESLRARLARHPLPLAEIIHILRDVAKALTYAHERGIVHRDIKPDNVLISGGTAVVTDFGIAKALAASRMTSGVSTLTQVGTSVGTPAYMSPEQAAGDPEVDHRADLYSFGCMTYELLTGRPPFVNRTPQRVLAAHVSETPQHLAELRLDVPPALVTMVMRCLEKDASARPQTALELFDALDASATSDASRAAMPAILLGGRAVWTKILALYGLGFVAVALVAKAAIVGIGLPDWVFPGALLVMALGLPVILFTAYVQYVVRRTVTASPTFTPGGSPSSMTHGTMATIAIKASPHLSWKRATRGVAYALGLFVLAIGGYMALRALGIGPAGSLIAAGSLTARDRILVADFRAPGADSALGGVVAEALRTNLAQSRAIGVVSASGISDALQRMQRPPSTRLDVGLARELAEREGVKAVVHGDITPAGQGFILTVRLVTAATGDELASFREAARDASDLIPAIDRATRDLRGKFGESLKAVHESPPLMRVTTASLPALRKYTDGMTLHYRQGEYLKAAAAFEEAIRLDSGFAMAYTRAATAYANAATRVARSDTLRRLAFVKRDRLPDLERAMVEGVFYTTTVARRDSAIAAFERVVALDSTQSTAWNQLGILYDGIREPGRALAAYRHAIAADPANPQPQANIVSALIDLGRFAEARAMIDAAYRHPRPNTSTLLARAASMEFLEGRYDSAAVLLDRARRQPRSSIARAASGYLVDLNRARGKLVESAQLAGEQLAEDLRTDAIVAAGAAATIPLVLDSIYTDLLIRERSPAEVLPRLDALLQRFPRASVQEMTPSALLQVATAYAVAGRADRARAALARYDRDVHDSVALRDTYARRRATDGEIALAERRYAAAIEAFRAADVGYEGLHHNCAICIDIRLARAFDLADMRDSAVAALERYVGTPNRSRWDQDSYFLAGAHKRLGELYEARGDVQKAASHYAAFIELWKNADPELRPKLAEVRKRLARLSDTEVKR